MSLCGKEWIWPSHDPDLVSDLAEKLDLPHALAHLLINRGISDPEQARAYLSPDREQLHSPWLMQGMRSAVNRLMQALEKNEKILVYGDYDADGIAATAILVETLEKFGGNVEYYLPSRFDEGYGLHIEPLKKYREEGFTLAVTVDCGINAVDEVAYAANIGLDMIVTDHHLPFTIPVTATAVINPMQKGCPYPFKELSGAGIAFKLAQSLMEQGGYPFPDYLLDLAALGTAADVVPLLGENRVIVASGLDILSALQRTGFKVLAEKVKLDRDKINSTALAFILAPSINAAGRMGEALPAAKLMLERDIQKAGVLAEQLHSANLLRRTTEAKILKEAEKAASAMLSGREKIITLSGEGWHHGVIGIVASRLVEKFNRPVFLIALEEGEGRGSARSISGFDITAALSASAALLERFGGHEQAAGFTIKEANINKLKDGLEKHAGSNLSANLLNKTLKIEVELDKSEICLHLAKCLEKLHPHGMANPVPLFASRGWQLQSWRLVGSDKKHLRVVFKKEGKTLETIFFSGASVENLLQRGRLVDIAFKLKRGCYKGEETLDVELRDLKYSDVQPFKRFSIIDRRGVEGRLDNLLSILRQKEIKAVIFISTQARLEKIKSSCSGENDHCYITGGSINKGLVLPDYFNTVILYDLPFHGKTLEQIFKHQCAQENLSLYLLFDRADLKRNRLILERSLPTTGQIEKIVAALLATHGKQGEVSFPTVLEKTLGFKAGSGFQSRVEKILVESGILDRNYYIKDSPLKKRTLLERFEGSSTYLAVKKLRYECENFQKDLLEKDPDFIASLLARPSGNNDVL